MDWEREAWLWLSPTGNLRSITPRLCSTEHDININSTFDSFSAFIYICQRPVLQSHNKIWANFLSYTVMAQRWSSILMVALNLLLIVNQSESAPQAFRRDPGHPQWHHGAFQDVRDSIRSDIRRLLHTRAEVSLSFSSSSSPPPRLLFSHFDFRYVQKN